MKAGRLVLASTVIALFTAAHGASAAPKHLTPVPQQTLAAMQALNVAPNAPILVRAFKKEAEMEVWKQARDGKYVLLKTFPICRWSGQLGPKRQKGDRQTPEGFYSIRPSQMNPNSSFYLSFDTGFPNAYDRANRANGSALMVHGNCSSAGCFAMTDDGIREIYALARTAFDGGQASFQFQSYPFRMTAENIVRHRRDPNVIFWSQLKEGSDRFESTREEPTVGTAGGRYVFVPYGDRASEGAALDKLNAEAIRVATILAEGRPAFSVSYADGGQHSAFRASLLPEVSRPEALAAAGVEREIPGTGARQAFVMPAMRQLPPVSDPLPLAIREVLGGNPVPVAAAVEQRPETPTPKWPAPLPNEPAVTTSKPFAVPSENVVAMTGATPIVPAGLTPGPVKYPSPRPVLADSSTTAAKPEPARSVRRF